MYSGNVNATAVWRNPAQGPGTGHGTGLTGKPGRFRRMIGGSFFWLKKTIQTTPQLFPWKVGTQGRSRNCTNPKASAPEWWITFQREWIQPGPSGPPGRGWKSVPSYSECLERVFLELVAAGCSGKSGKKSVAEWVAKKQIFAGLAGVACNLKWLNVFGPLI